MPWQTALFSVKLDFGAVYPGASRFLEIHVKTGGSSGGFQQLLPRQQAESAPYSVRSLNAANADTAANSSQLGGIPATGYIQNTNTQQPANFNISGSGVIGGTLSAGTVVADTQYNIGGVRVLSATAENLYIGLNAGAMGARR